MDKQNKAYCCVQNRQNCPKKTNVLPSADHAIMELQSRSRFARACHILLVIPTANQVTRLWWPNFGHKYGCCERLHQAQFQQATHVKEYENHTKIRPNRRLS